MRSFSCQAYIPLRTTTLKSSRVLNLDRCSCRRGSRRCLGVREYFRKAQNFSRPYSWPTTRHKQGYQLAHTSGLHNRATQQGHTTGPHTERLLLHVLFTFLKVLDGFVLEVLEQILAEPLLQAIAVEPEQTLQAVPEDPDARSQSELSRVYNPPK